MRAHTKTVAALVALAGALFLPALAAAAPTPLVSPALLGVAPLPGPIAPASTPAATMTTLTSTPDVAPAGKTFTLTGSGLPASQAGVDRLEHVERDLGRRCAARLGRLSRPLGDGGVRSSSRRRRRTRRGGCPSS